MGNSWGWVTKMMFYSKLVACCCRRKAYAVAVAAAAATADYNLVMFLVLSLQA